MYLSPVSLPAHTRPAGNTNNCSASGTILARHLPARCGPDAGLSGWTQDARPLSRYRSSHEASPGAVTSPVPAEMPAAAPGNHRDVALPLSWAPRCGIAVVQAGPGGPVGHTTGTTRPASRALTVEATPMDASSRLIPLNSYHPSRRSRVLQSDGTGRPGRSSPGNCRMPPDLRVDIERTPVR
jgi:hypothetical protein